MKKLNLNEEFSLEGTIYLFAKNEGKIYLKMIGKTKSKPSFTPPTLMEVKEYFFASPTIYKADFLHILKEKLWSMRELALNENGRLYFGEYKQGFNSALEKAQELIDKEF